MQMQEVLRKYRKEEMKKTALAMAAAIGAASSYATITAVSHDMYGGDAEAWQVQRHEEKMAIVKEGGAKLVFIGDSITHFWEWGGEEQLKKYYSEGDWKMLDLGTSADRTEHVLWRLNEGGELDGYEAKCVMLMIGTNNTGHRSIEEEPPADTIFGIREILKTICEKQPKATVVLVPIFPRGETADDWLRVRNSIVNKEIQKFADGKKIFWCDFTDQFLTSDGRLSPDIFPDRLHPNSLGYEIWHAAVKPYFDYALSDGKLPVPVNRYASHVDARVYRIDQKEALFPAANIYSLDGWWLERLFEKRNQIADAGGEIDLVFFGDSITHNWENEGKDSLDELRKTYSVLDIGYSGDKTENLLWRAMYGGELDGYKAKCVMLMIGTNNTWHRWDSPEDIAAGIRKILDVVAKKQPDAKTLLLPIFPFGPNAEDEKRVNNEKVNAIIKGFADGDKVIWVDFNAKFLDEKGDNVALMPDHCHPNEKGYAEVWLPSVLPYFKEICGK